MSPRSLRLGWDKTNSFLAKKSRVNNILDTISQQSQGFVPGLLEILTFRHQHDGQHARGGSSLFVPQAEWRGP